MYCIAHGIRAEPTMPPVMAYDDRSWPDDERFVDSVAFDCLCVPVTELARTVDFYAGLFAMRLVAGRADGERAVLSRGGRVRLAFYVHGSANDRGLPVQTITVIVDSIERARAVIWDLGIPTLTELRHADDSGRQPATPSFAIRDPDGHEVRFVERQ